MQVLREGEELVAGDGRRVAADDAVHLPPVAPSKIVAVHLNHRSRVAEFGATLPPAPTYFHKPTSALVGHGGAVVRPGGCRYLNYEGEVAIVIGRTCRGVPPSQAGDYIAGYTIANDFGLHDFRDTDAGSMLRVKGSDTMAPLGPGLVTGWDFHGKRLRTYVNGRLAQDGSTDEMQWDMHYLVADIARTITLYPGDVLLSGTPANSRPVQPGDVVEVEVDGLGRLANHIVAGAGGRSRPDFGAQPADERGGHLHRARRGLGVPRHPAADPGLTGGGARMDRAGLAGPRGGRDRGLGGQLPAVRTAPVAGGQRRAVRRRVRRSSRERLRGNYPYFHPSYAGQMLKPPHPAAVAGYLAAMLINPNNHALDGGPVTSAMEKEVVAQLAAMFGFGDPPRPPDQQRHHRQPGGAVRGPGAASGPRHRLQRRGALHPRPDVRGAGRAGHRRRGGRRGPDRPRRAGRTAGRRAASGRWWRRPARPGSAPSTRCTRCSRWPAGTGCGCTSTRPTAASSRCWPGADGPAGLDPAPWRAIAECDSVVVDPHKHGLQPYGCGAVLFADPAVGRLYSHDSPYTYFTSDELHLGEISLECSRAGAAAAALWLTFQLLPPRPDGLGQVLAAGRRAALDWAGAARRVGPAAALPAPELDIVSYFPVTEPASLAAIDQASARMLADGMNGPGRTRCS